MNEQIQPTTNMQQLPVEQPTSNKHKSYWGLLLLAMGIVLALAEYKMYKNAALTTSISNPNQGKNTMMATDESTATVTETVAEEDQAKPTTKVSDEILDEMDSLENSDITAPIGGDQLSDMKE